MRMEAGSQYEGRNPDGSSFRLQFPMGNNETRTKSSADASEGANRNK
jgi:hypothetical protein